MRYIFITVFGIVTSVGYSQNTNGYWDYQRATKREFTICAGCKQWQRTDEFPEGTTEILYRITMLDQNQQLAKDLSTTLAATPYAQAQGAAGAISLASAVAGSDKCKFTIFSNSNDANNYLKSGTYETGCFIYPNDVSRSFVGRLSLTNSPCLKNNPYFLWFGFKGLNMFMDARIVLEVIPWVDYKASRGWSLDVKNSFIKDCVSMEFIKDFSDPDQYCHCLLDKFQNNFQVHEFRQMTSTERGNISKEYSIECFTETGEILLLEDKLREESEGLAEQGKYGEAATKLLDVINNGTPTATDYNNIGYYYLFTKQFLKAVKFLKDGENIDPSDLLIKGNLAHAYLLNGDFEMALDMYQKYKRQNITETLSWIDMVKSDFEAFIKHGLHSDDFQTILDAIQQTK